MTKKEKVLICAAIESLMAEADAPNFWEEGMEILSHLIGNRTEYSKALIKKIWQDHINSIHPPEE